MSSASRKKCRIGFYTNNPGMGGSELYVKNLIDVLDKDRFECFLFLTANAALRKAVESSSFLKVVVVDDQEQNVSETLLASEKSPAAPKVSWLRGFYLKAAPVWLKRCIGWRVQVRRLSEIFRKYDLDVLQTNEHSPCFEAAAAAGKKAGIARVIATIHFIEFDLSHSIADHWINQTSLKVADEVVFVSEYSRSLCTNRYPFIKDKSRVIYSSVDVAPVDERQIAALKSELNLRAEQIVVVVPAGFNHMKGHHFLMQALPTVVEKCPNVKILLLGDGPLKTEIQDLVKSRNLQGHCSFLGFRKDVGALMAMSDIVALPSKMDNLPLTLIEAMLYGRPVLASRVGGIPEIVDDGQTGLLVRYQDANALADALIRLIKDSSSRVAMGERGLQKACESFSIGAWRKAFEDLYVQDGRVA